MEGNMRIRMRWIDDEKAIEKGYGDAKDMKGKARYTSWVSLHLSLLRTRPQSRGFRGFGKSG